MKHKIRIIVPAIIILAVVVTGILVYLDRTKSPENEAPVTAQKGEIAPDFTIQLLSGESFTLSDHRGKVVFLNFWATWCGPCVAEMPAIQALHEEYGDSVVFLGLDYAESEQKVRDFIEARGLTYHFAVDGRGGVKDAHYPSNGIPYTLVVNAEGLVTEIFLGGGDRMHDIFKNAIDKALAR